MNNNLLKSILLNSMLIIGIFFIPDCFVSRHVTTGVFGIAILVTLYTLISLKKIKIIRITQLSLLIFLFSVIWLLYQFFYSVLSWHDWIEYTSFILLFFIFSQEKFDKKRIKQYFFICTLLSSTMSIWGLFQYLNIVQAYYTLIPITGSFENPAGIAIFLSALLPFSLYFIQKGKKWEKVWGLFVSLLTVSVIFLSDSRTGIIIVVIIFISYFYQSFSFALSNRIVKRYLLPGILLLLLIGLYFYKKDSADGRILIWKCTLDMFYDHWILGIGSGKFQAEYMLYQAAHFQQYPDSIFATLADNVNHPFNEYFKILVEYGILGFTLIIMILMNLMKIYKYHKYRFFLFPISRSIMAVALAAFFSYPLNYPGIVLILVLNVTIINSSHLSTWEIKKDIWIKSIIRGLALFSFLFFGVIYMYGQSEYKWYQIAHTSLTGKTKEMLPHYQEIYKWMGRDGLFLYNYGVELQQAREYQKSNKILNKCLLHLNDFDIQLVIAENYLRLKQYKKAEQHLLTASNMCPIRFTPLYKLMNLYLQTGETLKAKHFAEVLINKPIKIPSPQVDRIKKTAKEVLVHY